jgi:hypothetical protein
LQVVRGTNFNVQFRPTTDGTACISVVDDGKAPRGQGAITRYANITYLERSDFWREEQRLKSQPVQYVMLPVTRCTASVNGMPGNLRGKVVGESFGPCTALIATTPAAVQKLGVDGVFAAFYQVLTGLQIFQNADAPFIHSNINASSLAWTSDSRLQMRFLQNGFALHKDSGLTLRVLETQIYPLFYAVLHAEANYERPGTVNDANVAEVRQRLWSQWQQSPQQYETDIVRRYAWTIDVYQLAVTFWNWLFITHAAIVQEWQKVGESRQRLQWFQGILFDMMQPDPRLLPPMTDLFTRAQRLLPNIPWYVSARN